MPIVLVLAVLYYPENVVCYYRILINPVLTTHAPWARNVESCPQWVIVVSGTYLVEPPTTAHNNAYTVGQICRTSRHIGHRC